MEEPDYDVVERVKESLSAAWVITAMIVLLCFYFIKNFFVFLFEKMYELFIQRKVLEE